MKGLMHRVRAIREQCRTVDLGLAALADLQHGVVARWQLLELGLSADQIQRRLGHTLFHCHFRGIYAVGRRKLNARGRWMASVLACGPDALLSHRAALALWGLRPTPSGMVDVTVTRRRRGQAGIRIHHTRTLHPDDRTEIDGIPVTSLARTLIDWAETARPQHIRRVLEEIIRRETLLDGRKLEAALARAHNRKGARLIRESLDSITGSPPWTQSELEDAFLALIRENGLPEPLTQAIVAGERPDFLWPHAQLIAETDGYESHKGRGVFEDDRRKMAKFQVAGLRVIRPTQRWIETDPGGLLRDLRTLLGLSDAPPAAAA